MYVFNCMCRCVIKKKKLQTDSYSNAIDKHSRVKVVISTWKIFYTGTIDLLDWIRQFARLHITFVQIHSMKICLFYFQIFRNRFEDNAFSYDVLEFELLCMLTYKNVYFTLTFAKLRSIKVQQYELE